MMSLPLQWLSRLVTSHRPALQLITSGATSLSRRLVLSRSACSTRCRYSPLTTGGLPAVPRDIHTPLHRRHYASSREPDESASSSDHQSGPSTSGQARGADREGPGPLPSPLSSRYRGVRRRPRVIYDVHEEQQMALLGIQPDPEPEEEDRLWDAFHGWGGERGRTGVFDVEELVAVLRAEGLEDICVIQVPEERAYVSHLVLATGRSYQHMLATAKFLKRLYKHKRAPTDPVPRIEGKDSREWMALDLGNIAVHLLERRTREVYDIETLWAVGPQHDEQSQRDDSMELLVAETGPLAGFSPAGGRPPPPSVHRSAAGPM